MADTPPNNPLSGMPPGASPLKKSTGKVQPKKETVRINLPPKPTAAPTIKLPTLPPGGPTGATTPAVAPAAPVPGSAPAAPAVKTAAAPALVKSAAPTAAPAAAAPRPASAPLRPVAAPAPVGLKTLDTALIYSAVVASLVAVGGVVWVFITLKNTVESFTS